jgi:hypothetical protein
MSHDIDLESEDEADESNILLPRSFHNIPTAFIEIFHHPHSGIHTPTRIPLDSTVGPTPVANRVVPIRDMDFLDKPWAPFKTQADFEFAEQVVTKCIDKDTVNTLLDGFNGNWASETTITFRCHLDLQTSLSAARRFGIQVCFTLYIYIFVKSIDMLLKFTDGDVNHVFRGQTFTFKFKYRNPWLWLLDLLCDPTLCDKIMWFPVQKILNNGYKTTRIFDDLNTGDAWWEIQVSLFGLF